MPKIKISQSGKKRKQELGSRLPLRFDESYVYPTGGHCPSCKKSLKKGFTYLNGGAYVGSKIVQDAIGSNGLEGYLTVGVMGGSEDPGRGAVYLPIVPHGHGERFELRWCSVSCMEVWLSKVLKNLKREHKEELEWEGAPKNAAFVEWVRKNRKASQTNNTRERAAMATSSPKAQSRKTDKKSADPFLVAFDDQLIGDPLQCLFCKKDLKKATASVSLDGGALYLSKDKKDSIGAADRHLAFLSFYAHKCYPEPKLCADGPDESVVIDVIKDTYGGQFELCWCSLACMRKWFTKLFEEMESQLQSKCR